MGETLNIDGIHNNGLPELHVGIRGKEFILSLDSDTGIVTLKNPLTGKKLKFAISDIITDKMIAYLSLEQTPSGGELLVINSDNTIKPATITETDIQTALTKLDQKANKSKTLGGYGIINAYTKTEIDGKIAGAFHFKGTYATFAALTAAVTDGTITPSAGDVYNITTGGGTDINGNAIKAGDNVAYITEPTAGWDTLSGTIDLSAYATTEFVNTELAKKANSTDVNTAINKKADSATTLSGYGITDAYTKSEVNTELNKKANDSEVSLAFDNIEEKFSRANTAINKKADSATTLSGYGITDAYTKSEVNTELNKKANASAVPTITPSTTAPTSSTPGKVGDLYIVYSE